MGQWSKNAGHLSLSERVRAYLALRHPAKTAEAVEAATRGKVRADAYRKAAQRGGSMSADALAVLIITYGPDLAAAALPGCGWLSDAARAARAEALERDRARLADEIEVLRRRA